MHATRAREETTPAYAQTRGFNQNKFEKRSAFYYCGIFEKKFGFYRAELDRFCVIVFGMRARAWHAFHLEAELSVRACVVSSFGNVWGALTFEIRLIQFTVLFWIAGRVASIKTNFNTELSDSF